MKLVNLSNKSRENRLPMVPLKDLVVFPHMVVPFFVGRQGSIAAVKEAMAKNKTVFLACQKNSKTVLSKDDVFTTGTIARILQMLKLPDGTVRVLVEGQIRGRVQKYFSKNEAWHAQVRSIPEYKQIKIINLYNKETAYHETMVPLLDAIQISFQRFAKLYKKISPDVMASIKKAEYPDKLVDLICGHVPFSIPQKIELLEKENLTERLENLAISLEGQCEVLALQHQIQKKVKNRIEKSQKEYFLNEQIKEIRKELGQDGEDDPTRAKEIEKKLEAKNLPEEVLEKVKKDVARLAKLPSLSPEGGILRTYLEWIQDLPWNVKSKDNKDIEKAAKILDEDHYNMKKPKDRVLDFIAVRQLKEKLKGPILCLVGPPGTGKTSLGKSIARALNREFVRISLGGVKDEAEIRGHRKTYVGSLPGKIIQSMNKVGTINPVFLLDEIDKINSAHHGDPAAALLEVLDPEQNSGFIDHYLEVSYDLSNVMFITTANSVHTIPHPLRDRMEVIEVPGYTDFEKLKIASDFIIPKQLKENGLEWARITFQKSAVLEIIRNYTMESGVRNLEREIAAVIRKIARLAVQRGFSDQEEKKRGPFSMTVTVKQVRRFLGKPKFSTNSFDAPLKPGMAHGLAWTEMGGTLLTVEAALLDGSGELILTGNLGDVMKESARTALSFIRANHQFFAIDKDFQKSKDLHIHVPEGGIPKDGPSAGITIAAAIISSVLTVPLRQGFAMTGEITLTGRLLSIGGVKEKVLAAFRHKMHTVVMPEGNRKDMDDIPKEVASQMNFIFTDSVLDGLYSLLPEIPSEKKDSA